MRSSQSISFWTRVKRAALAFDAWLNSSLFQGGRGLAEAWEGYSNRLRILRVRGFARVIQFVASLQVLRLV